MTAPEPSASPARSGDFHLAKIGDIKLAIDIRMLVGQKEFGGGRDLTRLVAWIRATESDQCQRSPSR